MKRAFNQASVIKTLRAGLSKPNPENPSVPMWTLEDLDVPPQYTRYSFRERRKALKESLGENFNEDIHMPRYQNLLREPNTDIVQVEVIAPRDLLPPSTNA